MASGTVAVRLPDEVISELQKIAAAQNIKVSDVVKDLITNGLAQQGKGDQDVLMDLSVKIQTIEKLGQMATKAALKAQFLANMSASFSVDVARHMTAGEQRSTEEKNAFMSQMDEWAEGFASEILEQDRRAPGCFSVAEEMGAYSGEIE